MRLGTSSPLEHIGAKDWAKKHKDLGLGAVNFHLNCNSDSDLVDEFVKEAKENDLVIAEVGVWRNLVDPDEKNRKENVDYAVEMLKFADRIGSRCCVGLVGGRGPRWDGHYKDNLSKETWKLNIKTIQEIIDRADPKNTYFTIESMPWMFPMSPDDYVRMIDEIERDRFAVHLDALNWIHSVERYFYNEEFVDECFDKLGKLVKSCHLKDVLLKEEYTLQFEEVMVGKGGVNLKHLIETAEKYDPEMPVIIEHLNTEEEYLESIKYVKNLVV